MPIIMWNAYIPEDCFYTQTMSVAIEKKNRHKNDFDKNGLRWIYTTMHSAVCSLIRSFYSI